MILRVVFFGVLFFTFANGVPNPYESLNSNEKINIMVNYFVNEELKALKPEMPQREKLKDDDANLDPVRYEEYFSYIQRLKAIQDSRVQEKKKIDEKYAGRIAFYNGKIKALEKFYTQKENFNPILKNSINKALKVVYGKPIFQKVVYDETKQQFFALLGSQTIYQLDQLPPLEVQFDKMQENQQSFLRQFEEAKIKVLFDYSNNWLKFKSIIFTYKNNTYKGNFVKETNQQIKLNIKINDDIFRLEKIE